ncbi:MAG: bifunctional methylenetetrahydrofolate dehydrogenase/methenyltetrahydrofolate cyclohydrolase [Leptospiraceae bacterium]|nr:bifunctional methylenetetrahydrofolate dehydrogenase/methenyltetrahydrofolate cyclohydrolase [Leptospiraceae bacterium]
MATLLDGKKLSAEIRSELKQKAARIQNQSGREIVLATILVGDDPASATYVKMKARACESIGITSRPVELSASTSTAELLAVIDELNADAGVRGILLQHPVPEQIDERACFDRIQAAKDVDGVTTLGFGQISFGLPGAYPACTPAGIIRLMDAYQIQIEGQHAVVVGRSAILGRPVAELLLNRNATVTVCHSRTRDLESHLSRADIVIAAVGKPEFIHGRHLKPGVVVMDAGYNPGNVGDVEFASCEAKASYITPVPGGVGPMTITMLLEHTMQSAQAALGQ